jgi:hypothetical protein
MTTAETLSVTTAHLRDALALVRQAQANLDALIYSPGHVEGVRDARWSLSPVEERIEKALSCVEPRPESNRKGNIIERLERLRAESEVVP